MKLRTWKDIAEQIGEKPLNVRKDMHNLKELELAESQAGGLWQITDDGRERVEGGEGKEKGKKGERKGKEITKPVSWWFCYTYGLSILLHILSLTRTVRLDT